MSQNITASCRRSGAADPDWVGTRAVGAGFGAVAIWAETLPPHSAQNLALGGLAAPHVGQLRGKAEPHSAQYLAAAATTALQLGHSTSVPNINDLRTLAQSRASEERWSRPN